MNKYISITLVLLVSSCSKNNLLPASITSTPLNASSTITNQISTKTQKQTPSFSLTIPPTETNTSIIEEAPTNSQTLNPLGPYLVFTNAPSPVRNIVLLNPDGSGQKIIPLPDKTTFVNGFSPNGEWGELLKDESLQLMHLPDGNITFISQLFFGENTDNYSWDDCPFPEWLFRQTAWSPDGRYLAFAANKNEKAFNLYTYDSKLAIIRQLTNDSADILSIYWSQDSKYIYFINGNQPDGIGNYITYTINVTQPENSPNQGISTLIMSSDILLLNTIVGNNYLVVVSFEKRGCGAGGPGYAKGLTIVDLVTGDKNEIWSIGLSVLAVDPVDNIILLYDVSSPESQKERLIIISIDGKIISSFDIDNIVPDNILYRGGKQYTFLMYGDDGEGVFGITAGGKFTKISERDDANISVSPHRDYFVVFNDKGMDLFSRDDELIDTSEQFPLAPFLRDPVLWRPDKKGLYFEGNVAGDTQGLYYWEFAKYEMYNINQCSIAKRECGYYYLSWVD
jgi:hypothetical protein